MVSLFSTILVDPSYSAISNLINEYAGDFWGKICMSAVLGGTRNRLASSSHRPIFLHFPLSFIERLTSTDLKCFLLYQGIELDWILVFKTLLMSGEISSLKILLSTVNICSPSLNLGYFVAYSAESRAAVEELVRVCGPGSLTILPYVSPNFGLLSYSRWCEARGVTPHPFFDDEAPNATSVILNFESPPAPSRSSGPSSFKLLTEFMNSPSASPLEKQVVDEYALARELWHIPYTSLQAPPLGIRIVHPENEILLVHALRLPSSPLPAFTPNGSDPFGWDREEVARYISSLNDDILPRINQAVEKALSAPSPAVPILVQRDPRWEEDSETASNCTICTANDVGELDRTEFAMAELNAVSPAWQDVSFAAHRVLSNLLTLPGITPSDLAAILSPTKHRLWNPSISSHWLPYHTRLQSSLLDVSTIPSVQVLFEFQRLLPHIKLPLDYSCNSASWTFDRLVWNVRRLKTALKKQVHHIYPPCSIRSVNPDNSSLPSIPLDSGVIDWMRKAVLKRKILYKSMLASDPYVASTFSNRQYFSPAMASLILAGTPDNLTTSFRDPRSHPFWYYLRLCQQVVENKVLEVQERLLEQKRRDEDAAEIRRLHSELPSANDRLGLAMQVEGRASGGCFPRICNGIIASAGGIQSNSSRSYGVLYPVSVAPANLPRRDPVYIEEEVTDLSTLPLQPAPTYSFAPPSSASPPHTGSSVVHHSYSLHPNNINSSSETESPVEQPNNSLSHHVSSFMPPMVCSVPDASAIISSIVSISEAPPPRRGPPAALTSPLRLLLKAPTLGKVSLGEESGLSAYPRLAWFFIQSAAMHLSVSPYEIFELCEVGGSRSEAIREHDLDLVAALNREEISWLGLSPASIWLGGYLSLFCSPLHARLAVSHLGAKWLMPYYWAELGHIVAVRSAGDLSFFKRMNLRIDPWVSSIVTEMLTEVEEQGKDGTRWWARRWLQKLLERIRLVGEENN